MSQSNLDTIYSQIDSLPSLPSVVVNVLRVTADPESSAADLMKAILPDQSMCATILKIANSAFFGLPREVSTIDKAVMVLGFNEVKNIVLGKAVFNSFKELNGSNKQAIEHFWDHSFSCALSAKVIAERIDLSPSELFIAGLIHDIGKLAMLIAFPSIYSHLLMGYQENWELSCQKEQELFYICHDKVARKMLNRWLFPQQLVMAVGYHHCPHNAPEAKLHSSTLRIADAISHLYQKAEYDSIANYPALLLDDSPDLFDIWEEAQLDYSHNEIKQWLKLIDESHEKDTAILTIFTS